MEENVTYRKIKVRKLNKKNLILLIIFLLLIILFIISLSKIFIWSKENKEIEKQTEKVLEVTTIETKVDSENTEIIEQTDIDKSNPYWDYIKMDLIDVNFEELKNINKDTKGWIQVNGTNVNYPFVQTKDNDYYLNHSFDKTSNGGGWVYLDYRNNLGNEEKNTIIYGHGRQNKTIFGTLKNTLKSDWLNNTNNHIIKLSTEYENTLWQIFSIYNIPTTNDYIRTEFYSDIDYTNFLNKLISRSIHDFNTDINSNDRILTLSTCYDNDNKIAIHAKLIKREIKRA